MNTAELAQLGNTEIHFHSAYISQDYTFFQLIVRGIFTLVSLIVLLAYFSNVICAIPPQLQHMVTVEQRQVLPLLFFLFMFNDPLYTLHIYKPSFYTYALSELTVALFVSALLVYWIRDLAKFRKKKAPKNANKFGRLIHTSTGDSRVVGVFLGLFFFILSVDLWILQVILFYEVEADPSYAGKF